MGDNGKEGGMDFQVAGKPIAGFAVLKIEGGYAIAPLPGLPTPAPLEQIGMMRIMEVEIQTQYQVRQMIRMQPAVVPASKMPPNLRVLEKM